MPRAVRLLRSLLPPVVAFALSHALLHWTAITYLFDPWAANTWSRADSAHYLSIAEKGYEFFSCARLPGYDPKLWCGNTAWAPGYPLLIKLVAGVTNLEPLTAAVGVSWAFALAALFVIWMLFLDAEVAVGNLLTLSLAAFFPGHVYDHAVFPISLFALTMLLTLWFYGQQRFVLAALCAAAAAFTYTSGLFLCGVLGLHALLLDRREPLMLRLKGLVITCTGVLAGFAGMLALQWSQTGVWNGFFKVQEKYAYSPRTPFEAWANDFRLFLSNLPKIDGPSEQNLFVAGLCALMLGYLAWQRKPSRLDLTLASFTVVYWLVPIILGGQLSLYRAEATLLPAVVLTRKIPWRVQVLLLCGAIVLSRLMGKLFFKSLIA